MKEKGQNKNVRTEEKKSNTNKKRSVKGRKNSMGTPFDTSIPLIEASALNVTRRKNIKNPRVKKNENTEEIAGQNLMTKAVKKGKTSQSVKKNST